VKTINRLKSFPSEKVFFSILLAGVFLLSLFKIANYDIWWILADGRYIVENKVIPHTDVFRFVSLIKFLNRPII